MTETEFLPKREPTRKERWELEQQRNEQVQQDAAKRLVQLFSDNEQLRHAYAAIVASEGMARPQDIAPTLGVSIDEARQLCHQLADEWLVWTYYSPVYRHLREFPRTFHGYIRHYIERDEGEYYREAVLATLKGQASKGQQRSFESLKERWDDEQEIKALQLENAMLRIDLKTALAPQQTKITTEFLRTFEFNHQTLVSFCEAPKGLEDQAYEFCTQLLKQPPDYVKGMIKAVQQARKHKRTRMGSKSNSQFDAMCYILARLAQAYITLYEAQVGGDPTNE